MLATLAGGEPISIGQLAQVTVTKQPTVTRLLDRMEAKGQVERLRPRRRPPHHAGAHHAEPARSMVARLIALAREHEQRVLEPFGLQRAEELKTTLRQHDRSAPRNGG